MYLYTRGGVCLLRVMNRPNSAFKYRCEPSKEVCKKSAPLFSSTVYGCDAIYLK